MVINGDCNGTKFPSSDVVIRLDWLELPKLNPRRLVRFELPIAPKLIIAIPELSKNNFICCDISSERLGPGHYD